MDIKGKKILIIEDDSGYVAALSSFLEKKGWIPTARKNWIEGMKAVEEETFDAALVDCWLPGCSGFEMMQKINKVSPGLPVILMSGMSTEATVKEAIKQGAASFIDKSEAADKLESELETVIERAEHSDVSSKKSELLGKILLIDDHEGFRKAAAKLLRRHCFEVVEAEDANTALDVWKNNTFDCALIDIHLPDVNGIELARVLGAADENMVIAFISGEANREEKIEALKYSVTSCIDKSYGIERLPKIVESLINEIREKKVAEAEHKKPAAEKIEEGVVTGIHSMKKMLGRYETKIVLLGTFIAAVFALLILHYLSAAELKRIENKEDNLTIEEMYRRLEGYLTRDEERELDRERRR